MVFKYRFIKEWLEQTKHTAFTKEEIKQLESLLRRLIK